MNNMEQVNKLLALIEAEKQKSAPSKKQMRKWLREIQSIKWDEDNRNTYTGQDARYLMHTSTRTWEDDCE